MKAPFWVIFWILALELVIVTVLIPGNWTEKIIIKEQELLKGKIEHKAYSEIQKKAEGWWQRSLVDNGFYEAVYNHLIPNDAQRLRSRGFEEFGEGWFSWVKKRLEALSSAYYHILSRFAVLTEWAPYFLFILFPAVIDGLLTWKIKRTNFQYISPTIHHFTSFGLLYLCLLLIGLFIAPVVLDPGIIPVAIISTCLMVGLMIGNMQKRL